MKKAKNVSLCGGGGEFLNGSTESTAPNLDPSECTTKDVELTKASPFKSLRDEEFKSLSLRASKGCVAILFATGLLRRYASRNDSFVRSTHKELTSNYSRLTTKAAFTMAEILLSLTIIGVVAAITLPSLTGNINERTWNTQRKALFARFSQAIALIPAVNNYGVLNSTDSNYVADVFVNSALSKVLKINNVCDNSHFTDCGVPTSYTNAIGSKLTTPTTIHELTSIFRNKSWDGQSFSMYNSKAVAFETQNGESIVLYYNPTCRTVYRNGETLDRRGRPFGFVQRNMCVNLVYDLNGKKGPNTIGKDMGFMTVFNATDSTVVAPLPSNTRLSSDSPMLLDAALSICQTTDPETRLPNIDEIASLVINQNFSGMNDNTSMIDFWSGTKLSSTEAWVQDATLGVKLVNAPNDTHRVRCIKRF